MQHCHRFCHFWPFRVMLRHAVPRRARLLRMCIVKAGSPRATGGQRWPAGARTAEGRNIINNLTNKQKSRGTRKPNRGRVKYNQEVKHYVVSSQKQ